MKNELEAIEEYNDEMMEAMFSPLVDTNIDLHEINLDRILEDDFLREIPILKTVYNAFNLVNCIHNAVFMKKLAIFILNMPNVTEREKKYFLRKHNKDEVKFSEKLFEIIDKLDDYDKCKLESKIFEKYFYEEITKEEFFYYSFALKSINIDILRKGYSILRSRDEEKDTILPVDVGGCFLAVGMAEIATSVGKSHPVFTENSIKFLKIVFEEE